MNYHDAQTCKKCKYGKVIEVKNEDDLCLIYPIQYEIIGCNFSDPKWVSAVERCPLDFNED